MIHHIESEPKRCDVFLYNDIHYSTRFSMWARQTIDLKLNLIHPFYEKHVFPKVPVIVWLEGGGWGSATPFYRIPELSYYAYNGFAVADVRYSVSSEQNWPAQLEDAKCAIRFLRANADQFGIDVNNIFVAGESAGAHLAAMVGVSGDDPQFKTKEYSEYSDAVNGVVTWYCPGDFHRPISAMGDSKDAIVNMCESALVHTYIYDHPQLVDSISPTSYIKEKMPPFLMFHGDQDHVVDYECSVRLHDKLVEKGNSADLYIIKNAKHATTEFTQPQIHEKMLAFFKENLR